MATFASDVTPYDPRKLDDPRGGHGFEVDPGRCSVLVHDLLPYYVDVLDQLTRDSVIAGSRRVLSWARSHGVPLLASAPRPATGIEQRGLGGRLWGLGPSAGQAAESCLRELAERDVVWLGKRSLSAFFATDLDVELRRTGRDQLVIVGVFASQGIVATSFDALARDIECIVVSDAVADYRPELHSLAMHQVARSTGQVIYAEDLPAG
ncbi:isochorismatase family protein [Sinomonas sp. JGH33]|uniref:Isochorismatase family protein n=1 Tax=Sinomonas terricola TaxID=3110330 RepID=A0ABU5T7Y2_9MICC|nr:isochorismatase family protein [Sinomonas sp. JGH33]MEA5455794.1 isochorismatase family protein [Sinomonas sp. JGH33]